MILDSWKKTNTNANCIENGLYERSLLMEPSRTNVEQLDEDLMRQIFQNSSSSLSRISTSSNASNESSYDLGSESNEA